MNIILVPGFWLDASSWAPVTPALVEAGHRVHPLTLPGKGGDGVSRAGIGLADHIAAVVAEVDALDALDGPVVLVGHSGGGAIIGGVVDARPDRIARAIYVDSGPLGEGGCVNDELPFEGDGIPLPPWEAFEDADLIDLDEELRQKFREMAVIEPRGVAFDAIHLHDERRYDVPVTVIACEFTTEMLVTWMDAGAPMFAELASIHDREYVDLPTGHWPQLTRPADLGRAILAAVDRTH